MWFNRHKKRGSGLFGGLPMLLMGAAGMYYLDPQRGRRRRAMVRDKLVHAGHCLQDSLQRGAQYTRDRATGIVAETRACLATDHADDFTVVERVRSALGRCVSHPGAITVTARDGIVTLSGDILAADVDDLFCTVCSVRGVRDLVNNLHVHDHPGDVPSLQGVARAARRRAVGGAGAKWSPVARLAATAGGGMMALWGLARRDIAGLLGGAAGVALAARGLANAPAQRIFRSVGAQIGMSGNGNAHGLVDVQKSLFVAAPLERVFNFLANYQNFPHFMHNVREVRALDPVRSHWRVAGPMGIDVTWEADIVDYAPGEVIAWKSVPGATVDNAGVMRFFEQERHGQPGTRVDIKLTYSPPAGALGHIVARLFGADAKSEMDADLARVKTMLETGHPAHDAAQPIREMAEAVEA